MSNNIHLRLRINSVKRRHLSFGGEILLAVGVSKTFVLQEKACDAVYIAVSSMSTISSSRCEH